MAALLVGTVMLGSAQEESLQVIIHEFGQGRAGYGEWVELLVVGTGPGSTVDLRGWVFRDQQGMGQGGVYLRFTEHPLWAGVRAGTLIVFYNAMDKPNLPTHFPGANYDPEDFLLVLPAVTGDYFVLMQWAGLGNSGESLVLVDAEGRLVDGLSHVNRSGQLPRLPNVRRGQATKYVGASVKGGQRFVTVDGGLGRARRIEPWRPELRQKPGLDRKPAAKTTDLVCGFGWLAVA